MRRSLGAAALLLLAGLAAGCTLGPNYKRPTLDVPADWRDSSKLPPPASADNLANVAWWELFRDPVLQELIRTALAENQDLLIAAERIIEQRARVGFVAADLYPKIDLNTGAQRFENSREGFPNNPAPGDNRSNLFAISGDVSWELDVFGRIRRATESEKALLLATEESRRAVAISLVASVAQTYTEMRDADLRLEISRRTLVSREKSLELTRVRFRGGLTSEKDARQAEAEYQRVLVSVLQSEQLVREKENELSVLIGRSPGEVARGRSLRELPVALEVPAGLPSELLDRRPDLLAAEQQLHAATANIGAAKALLFPRFALTAGYGSTSTELDMLFTGGSQAWSVAAGVVQPIFNAGKNIRRVQITESQMRQTLYAYEASVLQALREVEDGLIAWRQTGLAQGAQGERVLAERRVVELSTVRYEGGVADYLEVLDAQRSLFSAELDEADTLAAHMISLIQLYKALGGGWPTEPADSVATDGRATAAAKSPG